MKTFASQKTCLTRTSVRFAILFFFISLLVLASPVLQMKTWSAEIFIDRTGTVQIDFNDLTDGSSNDAGNDGEVSDFNHYIARTSSTNPIEWSHQWNLSNPSAGTIQIDIDESLATILAAELFAVIWDVDYPSSSEHDIMFWDSMAYAGGTGSSFSMVTNPGAVDLGRVQGNNNTWGAKRISLDPALLAENDVEYFWLQVDEDPGGTAWKSSIDYSDLAIIFNEGQLDVEKSVTHESGFDPPRVGHTSYYRVRIDISNPTLTSTGGPMYDVEVTDVFPAGSTIVTAPSLGSATIDGAGNLAWDVGILQDGALNNPVAAGSTDFMEVLVPVTPAQGDVNNTIILNAGATITGGQVPEDPGDGTGTLYPFNYFSNVASQSNSSSVVLVTVNPVITANTGSISSDADTTPGETITITVTDSDLDTDPAAADTVTVTVVNQTTGESETVTLTETGANTGVFTSTLDTFPSAAAGANNDGTMNTTDGDTLRATYNDQADANGNPATVTSDTTVIDDGISLTITGPSGTRNTATLDVTGETDPHSTVTMNDPVTGLPLSTTADTSGNYTFSNVTFPEGSTNFSVTSTDPSGNVATASESVTVDTSNSVTISNPISGSTISSSTTDVTGTTDPNSTVTIIEPGTGNTLTTTADGAGNYTFSGVLLNNGTNTITVESTDTNSNIATTSATITVDQSVSLDITSITDGATYATPSIEIAGTTDPLSTVTMNDPVTGLLLITTADAAGNYTFGNVTFPEGATVFSVTSTDPVGNTTNTVTSLKVDTTNSISVAAPIPGSVISTTTIDVSGTTDPNATVTIVEPGTGNTLTTTADAAGNYTFNNVSLNIGANNLTLTSTDSTGNTATTSATVTVDQSISLNITSLTNGATYDSATQELAGTTDPGATVTTVHPTTGATLTTTADAAGNYTFGNITFPEGANTQTVNATDPAGNTATTTVSFTIDTNNSNTITTAAVSNVSSVDITGATDPGSTVTFTSPVTGQTFTTTADAAGNYSFDNIFFPDGTYTISTTSTDPVGNTSTDSSALTVSTTNSINTNVAPGDSVANTSPLPITGTTTPGSTVTITDPVTGATYTTTADANGDFTFAGINLAPGQNTVTIVSTDPNGVTATQTSDITYDVNITLDVQQPTTNTVCVSADQTVSGATVPNATVTMADPVTGATLTTTADANGNYSFGTVTFPQGSSTVTITADDGFGHTASITNTFIVAASGQQATLGSSENTVQGEPIFIEVSDAETYLDPNKIDTVQVTVSNLTNGDSETQTLVETGPNTGNFTGQVNTIVSPVSDGANSGTLTVQDGDTIVTTFTDPIDDSGALNTPQTNNTDITNDAIKISVNVFTAAGTGSSTRELCSSSISILEYNADGSLTGHTYNYTTDSSGLIPAEFIGRMKSDKEYRVLVHDPIDGYPYSQSESFTLADLENSPVDANGVRTYSLGLDPAGYVYDALTGARVDGADVTLYHQGGTQVAGPFSLFTQDPANTQTNPQLSGDSGMPGGFEFIGSGAASDLTAGYYYIEVIFNTNAALDSIYYPIQHSTDDWAGISEPYTGQEFLVNQQNQPIGMRVPLYRRAANSILTLSKSANKAFAAAGDIVTFIVTVTNPSGNQTDANNPVIVEDTLPHGLKYIGGSAFLSDGTAVTVTAASDGTLTFTVGRLDAAGASGGGDVVTITYMATVGTSAQPGMVLTNSATALIAGVTLSNTAVASVRVTDDPLFDRATLIGRVFLDANGNGRFDRLENGLGGVGLIMEDGTYITTGPEGKYSVPGADTGMETTGTRVIKIDMNSLPYGTALTTSESVFATLRPGDIDKANFGVLLPPDLMPDDAADEPAGNESTEKPARKKLFAVLADAVMGDFDSGAAYRPDTEFVPSGGFARGRVAYFYSLDVEDRFSIKSSYDSHKSHTFDIFSDRDRDRYYPTYGDGSTVRYLSETQGKFFLHAKSRRADLLIGSYEAAFQRTELAGVRRAQSGVKFELNRPRSADPADGGHRFMLFSTRRKQMHARSELRATGGTNYYLANTKITTGSEKITVQVRDSLVPERVNAEYELLKGSDYEIYYETGRLRLFAPVSAFADGDTLYHYGLEDGDPVWIIAEYSYTPEQNDFGAFGARYLNDTGHGVTLGMSYLRENFEGADHYLRGYDLHVGPEDREKLVVEYARSEAGGLPRMASYDAGRSYITLGSRDATSGSAFKARFTIREIENLEWENYYYLVDPDFTGLAFGERGVKRAGTSVVYGTDTQKWMFDYTMADSRIDADIDSAFNAGGGRTRSLRLGYLEKFDFGDITLEYLRDYQSAESSSGTNLRRGVMDSFAARYERKINEKTALLFGQQVTFQGRQHHMTILGVRVAVSKRISLTVEGSAGTAGGGGRLGFQRTAGSGSKTYLNVSSGREEAGADREIRTALGYSKPVSDNTDAYLQMETKSRADESVVGRTLGLNHRINLNDAISMSFSAERSEERSSLQGRYFTNALTWSGELTRSKSKVQAGAEYRDSQGAAHKHYFGARLEMDTPINSKLSSFSEYAFEVSDDLDAGRVESKYTKALAGLAWRPPWSDRLNLLARAGRVHELRTLAANDAVSPDTLATVLSMEGIFDVSHEFQIRGKSASKFVRESISTGTAGKTHTLLHIAGFTWRPSSSWYLRSEFRTERQPTQFNYKDGVAVEIGRYLKDDFRLGVGYNFSSHSDDEFAVRDNSYRGFFFTMSGKM